MDTNTLVAFLGGAAIAGLTTYGAIMAYLGIDSAITATVAGSLGAVIGAVATYLKTRQ